MIAHFLSFLFPPRLPGRVMDWQPLDDYQFPEQGWAGNVKRRYTGIERYHAQLRRDKENS